MQQTLSAERAKAQIDVLEQFAKSLERDKKLAVKVFREMGIGGRKVHRRTASEASTKTTPVSRTPGK